RPAASNSNRMIATPAILASAAQRRQRITITATPESPSSQVQVPGVLHHALGHNSMNLYLAEISAVVSPDKHAVLLLDQAGWQLCGDVAVPYNITLLPLPPKCPELNVMENVWQFMRDNWLSNRVFRDHDDIVDHCCHHWNRLVAQSWRIMSIAMRNWTHGF
ncbi:MAG: transposase, partial [Acetobacteraceae bacterium]